MTTTPGNDPPPAGDPAAGHGPTSDEPPEDGRDGLRRVVIEGVSPEVDCGRFPVKRVVGDALVVEADVFADGHDVLAAVVLHRPEGIDGKGERDWREVPMEPLVNDRWRARVPLERIGGHRYTLLAWVDHFLTWRRDLAKRIDAGQDVSVELEVGGRRVEEAAARAEEAGRPEDARRLRGWSDRLREWSEDPGLARDPAPLAEADGPLDPELRALAHRYPDRARATRYGRELRVLVDRERARFSTWYEFFPRSAGPEPGTHGTLQDARRMLPYIQGMAFDVVYLPPIHPVGRVNRKGPNNRKTSEPGDPGSPWAMGSEEGGHIAVHPDLGTLDDFRDFRADAEKHGLEVALDVAFQCAPDHPWVEEHPEWFIRRPDGSIRYAENPPKKYEDIYPINFESPDWPGLWRALKHVFEFWMDQGVRIFRVDNPHTKAFRFWDWLIPELRRKDPGVILLSEAFTRPKVMYRLAKGGFNQSYTYFAWRNTAHELRTYLEELVGTEVAEYFRPNFWPNTPDILTEFLQTGGRGAFMLRLVLAGTLSSNYGIYGPPFELMEHQPREPGSEEYLDSEKYQIRHWELDRPDSLRHYIARVNEARRENPALQRNDTLRFHSADNELLLVYSKSDPAGDNRILTVVNLDPHHTQSGWLDLDLSALGVDEEESYQVHDLLGGQRFLWQGRRNYVELVPASSPAHIFRVQRRVRSEVDFEYF